LTAQEPGMMTEKDLVRISKFTVTSADTDIAARIRPGALVNFLIQSAIQSADALGFGLKSLQKEKLFWVLSSLTLEVTRPLMWYENTEVETWPKDLHKLLYLRDFLIRDDKKEIIGRATSGWFAIDFGKHRPHKIEGDHSEIFNALKERFALPHLPHKLDPVKEGTATEIKSTYFDIDLNKHVTSTRYIDWMMDIIPVDFHLNHFPKILTINYLKETSLGETIRIQSYREDRCFTFEGINANTGIVVFRGKICF
jgi:medium-chain acyl-[acyl-carrier-protein] hydrolase